MIPLNWKFIEKYFILVIFSTLWEKSLKLNSWKYKTLQCAPCQFKNNPLAHIDLTLFYIGRLLCELFRRSRCIKKYFLSKIIQSKTVSFHLIYCFRLKIYSFTVQFRIFWKNEHWKIAKNLHKISLVKCLYFLRIIFFCIKHKAYYNSAAGPSTLGHIAKILQTKR